MISEKKIELVEGQLLAYNQRDIKKFCEYFHPQVKAYLMGTHEVICDGIDHFKKIYSARFNDNPELHCKLLHRTVLTHFIIDEEWVTGIRGTTSATHVVAIYTFKDQLISEIWFAK